MHISGVINPVLPSLEDGQDLSQEQAGKQLGSHLVRACFLDRSCLASFCPFMHGREQLIHTALTNHLLQAYTYQATFSPMSTLGKYKNTVKKAGKSTLPLSQAVASHSPFRKKYAKWTGAWVIPLSSQQEFCSKASLLSCLEPFFRSWLHGYMLSRTWWSIHNLWPIHPRVYTVQISSLTDCSQLKLLLSSFMSAVSLLEDGLSSHLSKILPVPQELNE